MLAMYFFRAEKIRIFAFYWVVEGKIKADEDYDTHRL